jgi:uncharacterized protein YbjT (DUF2867 family)
MSNTKKLIAVVGATGNQGGAVVRALQASGPIQGTRVDAQSGQTCTVG